MNFFKRTYKSITDFNSYKEFYLEPIGRSFLYLIKLSLIFCVILSFVLTCKYIIPAGEFLKEEFPSFKYQNNELIAEEQVYMDGDFGLFIVDSNVTLDNNNYSEEISSYENYYMFFKNAIIMKLDIFNSDGVEITYNYNELFSNDFSLEDNREQLNGKFYLYIYLTFIPLIFILYVLKTGFNILVLVTIIYLTRRMLQINLNYSNILNIAIYGYTLPLILELICILLKIFADFTVYSYDTMIIIIGYIYTITALFNIRKELRKLNTDYEKYQTKVKEEKENKK